MTVLAIVLMGASAVFWLVDRLANKPTSSTVTTEGVQNVGDIIKTAKDIAFPNLVFIVGFIILLFDQGWLTVTTGGGSG